MTAVATFELDPVLDELRTWLAAAVLTGAPGELVSPVGDSQAPLDAGGQAVPPPYHVLYLLPGVREVPPFAGAVAIRARIQVTSVGSTPSQARHFGDRVRKAIAGEDADAQQRPMDLTAAGVLVTLRVGMDDGAIDVGGGLWSWAETYELHLDPA